MPVLAHTTTNGKVKPHAVFYQCAAQQPFSRAVTMRSPGDLAAKNADAAQKPRMRDIIPAPPAVEAIYI
jgi:hypothetical protein